MAAGCLVLVPTPSGIAVDNCSLSVSSSASDRRDKLKCRGLHTRHCLGQLDLSGTHRPCDSLICGGNNVRDHRQEEATFEFDDTVRDTPYSGRRHLARYLSIAAALLLVLIPGVTISTRMTQIQSAHADPGRVAAQQQSSTPTPSPAVNSVPAPMATDIPGSICPPPPYGCPQQDPQWPTVYYGATPAQPDGGTSKPVLLFVHGAGGEAPDWWSANNMYSDAWSAGYRTAFVELTPLDTTTNTKGRRPTRIPTASPCPSRSSR